MVKWRFRYEALNYVSWALYERGRNVMRGSRQARSESDLRIQDPPRSALPAWRVLFSPLAGRDFRLYWIGNLSSLVGDQFQIIALALLVLELPQGASGLGAVLMVQALPRLVLSLASGVVIDRHRARFVLLASNLVQAVVAGALCGIALSGELTMAYVYLYAITSGIGLAFSYPSAIALIPELVSSSDVRSANSLSVSMLNLSRFLVPPIASALIAAAGVAAAFGVNSASFLIAAACVGLIRGTRGPPKPKSTERKTRWWIELGDGLRFARNDPPVWLAILMSALYSLGYYGAAFVSLPALAKLTLGAGEFGVGLVYSALGAGAVLGALVTGSVRRLPRPGLAGSLVMSGNGLALATVAFVPSVWLATPMLFFSGVCGAASAVIFFSLVQTRAPTRMRGRVMGIYSLAIVGTYPLSFGLAGMANGLMGSRATILCGGIILIAAGLLGLVRAEMRHIELPDSRAGPHMQN